MINTSGLISKYNKLLGYPNSPAHNVALQLLYSTVRQYNNLYAETQALRELAGFNKPFPFLRLPREIRDEIYALAFRAARNVDCFQGVSCNGSPMENPFKPPTSGLLLVNRQTYNEGVEILYAENVLFFKDPGELFALERRIGQDNCACVRKVCIWVRMPDSYENIPDPALLPQEEYDSVPTHWVAALKTCGLRNVRQLGIEAKATIAAPKILLDMPAELKECVEWFLTRDEKHVVPRLLLMGFKEEVRHEFPQSWEVVVDQWNWYKDKLEAAKKEMDEYEEYCRKHGSTGEELEDAAGGDVESW